MTTKEAAVALGVSIKHIMTLIWEGKLKAHKNSKNKWAVSARSVEARKNR